ncbi:unnamed protein product [Trichobilharzia regenti]|nr:unnamed protein product [Trichobilharzia regenti]
MEALTADVAALVSGMSQADKETIISGSLKTPQRLSDFVNDNRAKNAIVDNEARRRVEALQTLSSATGDDHDPLSSISQITVNHFPRRPKDVSILRLHSFFISSVTVGINKETLSVRVPFIL